MTIPILSPIISHSVCAFVFWHLKGWLMAFPVTDPIDELNDNGNNDVP